MHHPKRRFTDLSLIMTLIVTGILVPVSTTNAQETLNLPSFADISNELIDNVDGGAASPQNDEVETPATLQDAAIETAPAQTVEPSPAELSEPQSYIDTTAFKDSEVDENIFFDAEALVPQSELSRKAGPRKVDPLLQPGSKFIVVKKNHNASSRKAGIVSAERALKLGRYEAALDLYNDLYARNRRDPNVLLGRAVALHRLGQEEAAIEAYEQLLDLRPNNVEANVNMLGIIGQRFPAVALRRLMDLREKNRDHVGIVAQIAVVQANLKQYNDAIRYLSIAASIEPENASHVFNMGVIADKAGSKPEAIKFYEQALEIDTLYGRGETIPRETVFQRLAELR